METIQKLIRSAEEDLSAIFRQIDENEEYRTRAILDVFRDEGVSYRHFSLPSFFFPCLSIIYFLISLS